eukprot:2264089-Rhodomonas_salina.1
MSATSLRTVRDLPTHSLRVVRYLPMRCLSPLSPYALHAPCPKVCGTEIGNAGRRGGGGPASPRTAQGRVGEQLP